jgi:hypothetical protein
MISCESLLDKLTETLFELNKCKTGEIYYNREKKNGNFLLQ